MASLSDIHTCAVVYRENVSGQTESLCLIDVNYILQLMESADNTRRNLVPETIDNLSPAMIYKAAKNYLDYSLSVMEGTKRSELRIKLLPIESKYRKNVFKKAENQEDKVSISPPLNSQTKKTRGMRKKYANKTVGIRNRRKRKSVSRAMDGRVVTPMNLVHNTATVTREGGDDEKLKEEKAEGLCDGDGHPVGLPGSSLINSQLTRREDNKTIPVEGQRITLKSHKIVQRVNKCSVCSKIFRTKSELRGHMRFHAGEKLFQCEQCGRTFTLRGSLTHHMKRHSGTRPFKCSICDKAYFDSFSLKLHTRMHTGEKPYICEICGKSFAKNLTLKVHMRIHTEEKRFVCSICGRGFSQRTGMLTHFQRHEEQRHTWYRCEVCDQTVATKDKFEVHKRMHTGEKPYECEQCGKRFASSSYLWQHRKIHDQTQYQCVNCGKSYKWAHTLQQHTKSCVSNHAKDC